MKKAKMLYQLKLRRRAVAAKRFWKEQKRLWALKRARQKQCFEDIKAGRRTPESVLLFTPETVKGFTIKYGNEDFD